ncbi:MAG: c-type cytochrome [Lentisphaeraceae bacterium]|nr:c-type cytochrome [Lentisphaeraceae bacterium]
MKKMIFAMMVVMLSVSTQAVDFKKDIAPILEARCVKCHGAKKQKGEYRLSNAKDIVKAGESEEKPVVAGNADKSYLVKLISMSEDADDVMPPKGGTLSKDEIAKIKAWIKDGAKFPAGLELEDKSPKKMK